jgi:biofilm PGA synthesis N-glycosyltransferase PgaC
MLGRMRRRTIEVGIFAHDEEATIEACVRAVLSQKLDPREHAELWRVTIVSCASTDATDAIAADLAAHDARVRLLRNPRRRGKAHAINRFLDGARGDLLVLVSGDVVLGEGALGHLLSPFGDPLVGMTGARAMPGNDRRGIGALVHLLWSLHDRVARESPKLGEAIALRNERTMLPSWTRADEASLEADVRLRRGQRLVYCPEALVFNRGPSTLADWIEHRTRIAAAHCEIESTGYRPSTRDPRLVLRHALAHVRDDPAALPYVALAAVLEGWARLCGRARARRSLGGDSDGTWARLASARPQPRSSLASQLGAP